ncbi:hypothetical protein [Psychrobacillus sp. L4]|uniref:hypothetical protein n=1 Tax=Psychrobacillus sp. L4 TaxID=3236892 RepID=UPI0036F2536C
MNLIDNGLHSFKKTIEHLKTLDSLQDIEREYVAKEIVLSLHHSTETLFKYMVKKKNELLIFDNLKEYFMAQMNVLKNTGKQDFKGNTITFMEAIQRGAVLNKLELSETQYGSFEHLNSIRNAITHHEYDLTEKQINYLITQVITVVFPIYKEHIPNFSDFVRVNNLNIISDTQVKELHIWKFIRFFTLYKKFIEGKLRIDSIYQSGTFQRRQQQIEKEQYITYHKCPCCEKPFLVKENVIFENMDEKGYTGECLMCEIEFDKEDSYFSYLTSRDYDSIKNDDFRFGYKIVSELFNDTTLKEKITDQELYDIKQVYSIPENAAHLAILTDNYLRSIIHPLLDKYAEEIVDDFDSAKMDEGLWGNKLKESEVLYNLNVEDFEQIKQVIENFKAIELTDDYYIEALTDEYDFDVFRDHPNPHQDNEEEEVRVNINLSIDDDQFLEEDE